MLGGGEFRRRKYREVDRGGWMSCEMKVKEGSPIQLAVEYWEVIRVPELLIFWLMVV